MSIRDNLDISAYLVLGPENTLGRPVGDVVAQALDAGFTCIQVRSKVASAREIIALTGDAAQAIAQAGKTGQVALLIDDRLDCVLAAREQGIAVDGVHVGQSDIPVEVCRKLLGPDAIVGLSARCEEMLEYVKTADMSLVDYLGIGPLHETETKRDCGRAADGSIITKSFEDLAALHAASPVPIVVGGGVIDMKDFPEKMFWDYVYEFTRKPFPGTDFAIVHASKEPGVGVAGSALYAFEQLRLKGKD